MAYTLLCWMFFIYFFLFLASVHWGDDGIGRASDTNRDRANRDAEQRMLCGGRVLSRWRFEILPHQEPKKEVGFQSSRPARTRPR